MKEMIEWAQGNQRALMFLITLVNFINWGYTPIIVSFLEESSIRGGDLYVLWSDLCNKDVEKVAILCKNCPKEVLEDACSRQDYSGRELVKEYF